MSKTTKAVLCILLYILTMLALLLIKDSTFIDVNDLESSLKTIAKIAIGTYALILTGLFLIDEKFSAIQSFLILTVPFLFGHHLLVLMGKAENLFILNGKLANIDIIEASFFTLESLLALALGSLLYEIVPRSSNYIKQGSAINITRENLRNATSILFAITLLPTVYSMINYANVSYSAGYGGLLDYKAQGGSNIILIICTGMFPYLLLSFFITKKDDSKKEWIIILLYFILYSIQGSRISIFCLLSTIVLYIITEKKEIRKSSIVLSLCIGLLMLLLLSALSYARQRHGLGILNSLMYGIEETLEMGLFYRILYEVGIAFMISAASMAFCPITIPYQKGLSYLSAIVYLIPNRIVGDFYNTLPNPDMTLSPYLVNGYGLGSSFVAESYFNFGYYGILVSVVFGYLLGLVSSIIKSDKDNNIVKRFLAYAIFMTCSFYVRSDTRTLLRNIAWFVLPVIILAILLHKKRNANLSYGSDIEV